MVKTLARGKITDIIPRGGGLKFLFGSANVGDGGSIRLTDPMQDIIYAKASMWGSSTRSGSLTYNLRGSRSGKYLLVDNIYHSFGTAYDVGTPGFPHGGTSQAHVISFMILGR